MHFFHRDVGLSRQPQVFGLHINDNQNLCSTNINHSIRLCSQAGIACSVDLQPIYWYSQSWRSIVSLAHWWQCHSCVVLDQCDTTQLFFLWLEPNKQKTDKVASMFSHKTQSLYNMWNLDPVECGPNKHPQNQTYHLLSWTFHTYFPSNHGPGTTPNHLCHPHQKALYIIRHNVWAVINCIHINCIL